jgi:hypothetical protein
MAREVQSSFTDKFQAGVATAYTTTVMWPWPCY